MLGKVKHPKLPTNANGSVTYNSVKNREVCWEYDNGTGIRAILQQVVSVSMSKSIQ